MPSTHTHDTHAHAHAHTHAWRRTLHVRVELGLGEHEVDETQPQRLSRIDAAAHAGPSASERAWGGERGVEGGGRRGQSAEFDSAAAHTRAVKSSSLAWPLPTARTSSSIRSRG